MAGNLRAVSLIVGAGLSIMVAAMQVGALTSGAWFVEVYPILSLLGGLLLMAAVRIPKLVYVGVVTVFLAMAAPLGAPAAEVALGASVGIVSKIVVGLLALLCFGLTCVALVATVRGGRRR